MVVAPLPEGLDLRARRHQGRVDLQKVGTEPGIGEEFPEHPPVVLHARPGEVWHHMEPDLQPGVAEEAVRLDRFRDPVAPPVVVEDPVVQVLDAEFHLGHPHPEHPVDVLLPAPVRPRLERDRDAPDPRRLVRGKDCVKVRLCRRDPGPGVVVHRLHRGPDEPLLVLDRSGGHRPAHHDHLRLVDVVAERLKLPEPCLHLVVGVERVLPGPERRRFLARVTLGGGERVLRPARAGQAFPVRTGVG